jgi:hypothetical protein
MYPMAGFSTQVLVPSDWQRVPRGSSDATPAVAPRVAAAGEKEARMTKPDWLRSGYKESEERPVRFSTVSDMEVEPLYTEGDVPPSTASAFPASSRTRAASTRACTAGRLWTMRQFAGFGTAEDTNARFKFLLRQGQTGSRPPSICRRSWATTPTTRARAARSAARASPCRASVDARRSSTASASPTSRRR